MLWKLSFDDESLTKLRGESEKTLMEWFWRVLARVRLADLHRISKPGEGVVEAGNGVVRAGQDF